MLVNACLGVGGKEGCGLRLSARTRFRGGWRHTVDPLGSLMTEKAAHVAQLSLMVGRCQYSHALMYAMVLLYSSFFTFDCCAAWWMSSAAFFFLLFASA